MAPIVGSTPNRRPTPPPSCGGLPTGRSAAVGHLQINGISPMTHVDQRRHRGDYFYVPVRCGVCPLQVQGTSLGPAPPNLGVGEAGDDGPAGDRPPSDAAPRGPG